MPERQPLIASFGHAVSGLAALVRRERNARIHLAATVLVVASAATLRLPVHDLRWLILAIALVWIAEAMNTAIEGLADIVSADRSPEMGRVKDIAAGGVLVASVAAAAIGGTIFLPYLCDWAR
ncbi:MAG: diacylglycerol kinase family protein [Paracoccaceae bacterium]